MTYNSVLVIYNRLTKFAYFRLYLESSIVSDFAYEFLRIIFVSYRILKEIITDRDKLFTSKF